MPIIATTSPQRLREIIDRLAGLKTFAQIADYKDTLTHDEREDYEAWTQGLKGAVKPAPRSKAKSKPKTTLPATSIDWTPQKQLEKEKGMTFAQWADERATLTEDQIFDIEAVTQGLKRSKKGQLRAEYLADLRVLKQEGPEALGALEKMGWTPQKQLDKEKGMTFAQWGEERATLTEDQIFAIEAYTQGLEAIEEEEEEGLSEEEISELKKLEEEEGERLTPGLEEEEAGTMRKAYAPLKPAAPELIIKRTAYPKWWNDSMNAKIELTAPGSQVLATVRGDLKLFVATIVLTVTGETEISFSFGKAGSSGPIYLGGTDQPKGIVISIGNSPAPCESGPLTITATDPGASTPKVGGFATCYVVEK